MSESPTDFAIRTRRTLGNARVVEILWKHGGLLSASAKHPTEQVNTPPSADNLPSVAEQLGNKKVLIVDDDDDIRHLLQLVFKRHHIATLCAEDGDTAMACLHSQGDSVGIVLLDLTIPFTGKSTPLEAIRTSRPGLPVVIMSGYSEDHATATTESGVGFLRKPFRHPLLFEQISRLLS